MCCYRNILCYLVNIEGRWCERADIRQVTLLLSSPSTSTDITTGDEKSNKRIGSCRKLTTIVFGVLSTNMAQLHKNTAHAGTKSLIGKIQLPDSGVLTSRVFGRSKENESDTYHVCCGKPYVTGAPFVCDSCGAIKNCNSFQDEGEQDVEASSDEFLQKIFSSTFIYFIIHCLFSSKVLFSFMICIYVTIKTSGVRFIMYYGLI